ncbi:hypothetical protein NE237_025606 [Protea cynaroides]|uniref:Uncharacterized protein n=1 Tax=Protea cynaroides TaxID=273540 RepID=A0A9Q0H5I0_9MAGN|nr:hypothetical protein NE237_025606 [Protea cynaroides]
MCDRYCNRNLPGTGLWGTDRPYRSRLAPQCCDRYLLPACTDVIVRHVIIFVGVWNGKGLGSGIIPHTSTFSYRFCLSMLGAGRVSGGGSGIVVSGLATRLEPYLYAVGSCAGIEPTVMTYRIGYTVEDYVDAPAYGGVATLKVQAGEDEHDALCECPFCVYL